MSLERCLWHIDIKIDDVSLERCLWHIDIKIVSTVDRHRRLGDWIDYLSIFRVKNEVSVAKIASIILSIFRVKIIDYRFRFLE